MSNRFRIKWEHRRAVALAQDRRASVAYIPNEGTDEELRDAIIDNFVPPSKRQMRLQRQKANRPRMQEFERRHSGVMQAWWERYCKPEVEGEPDREPEPEAVAELSAYFARHGYNVIKDDNRVAVDYGTPHPYAIWKYGCNL